LFPAGRRNIAGRGNILAQRAIVSKRSNAAKSSSESFFISVSRSIIEIHSNLMGQNEPTIQRSIRATRVKKQTTARERFDD
jgi:hypothetical protein